MKHAKLEVTHHDNRGNADCPFGFVYFSDDSRVGYSPGMDGKPPVWHGGNDSGRWGPTDDRHIRLATEYLITRGVNLDPPVPQPASVEADAAGNALRRADVSVMCLNAATPRQQYPHRCGP